MAVATPQLRAQRARERLAVTQRVDSGYPASSAVLTPMRPSTNQLLVLRSEQAAGQASILIFPVTMLSNVYVPTSGMPTWLRAIADWNPVSALAAAIRDLFGNPGAPTNGTWQLEHPVPAARGS
jgi:hypothetical protein